MNSGLLSVVFGLLALISYTQALTEHEWRALRRIQACDDKLKKLGLKASDDLLATRVKITNSIFRFSKNERNDHPVILLEDLWADQNCATHTKALYYNRIMQQSKKILNPAFCDYAQVAAERFTDRCYKALSSNNWSGFEEAVRQRGAKKEANYVDELMGDQYAGKESFEDLTLYDRFAKQIFATKKARKDLESATSSINDFFWVVDDLFDNIANSDPAARMTTRIKNFYIARKLWADMKMAVKFRFSSFILEDLEDTERVLLLCVARATSVAAGIKSCASEYMLSQEETRKRLQDTCKPISREDSAKIGPIYKLNLFDEPKIMRAVKVCASINFDDLSRQAQPLFADQ